jgi:hypothetical protein
MGIQLDEVIPWGRTMHEYIRMFDLTPSDLSGSILDCGGGPASFNAEMTAQEHQVVSCDPLYEFTAAEIEQRVESTYALVMRKIEEVKDTYVWGEIPSPAALGEVRLGAMRRFIADFDLPSSAARYIVGALPVLPFSNQQFDLALCSHFLFTYSAQFSITFHGRSIAELCRVAREVRIFPLLDTTGIPSPALNPVLAELARLGYHMEVRRVPYEFQKGGDTMLCVHPS